MDCNMKMEYYRSSSEETEIRKGAWTEEEDAILAKYVALHGEGQWNSVARCAGVKRTGKSCRLRWLNYLRPNVRRGNITVQEQLLILHLHSRWGNRWSKIAQELPGRTDNEIKNYWRTRVVKQAKQLKCAVNSKQFRDTLRFVWIPRLLERIQAQTPSSHQPSSHSLFTINPHHHTNNNASQKHSSTSNSNSTSTSTSTSTSSPDHNVLMEMEYSEIQPFEAAIWTDENICFLQQQLTDDF